MSLMKLCFSLLSDFLMKVDNIVNILLLYIVHEIDTIKDNNNNINFQMRVDQRQNHI